MYAILESESPNNYINSVKSKGKRSATINGDIRLPGVFKDVVKPNEDKVLEEDTKCAYFIVCTSRSLISGHL